MIALVGESGAGKTSLVDLIPRFFDIEKGQILFDGIDYNTISRKSIRKQINNHKCIQQCQILSQS